MMKIFKATSAVPIKEKYMYIPDSVEGINREISEIYATLVLRPKRKPKQT